MVTKKIKEAESRRTQGWQFRRASHIMQHGDIVNGSAKCERVPKTPQF